PVELRERVALDLEAAADLARRLGEGVCLSTCNRTELYVAAVDGEEAERRAVAALAELEPQVEQALYRLHDHAAALHLFRVGAGAIPLEEIGPQLEQADVVVSSTSAAGYVLDAASVERSRRGRPLLLIDLAVPRDLDPAIHRLDGCYLYDIDDLEAIVSETLAGRRSEAERAESLVAAEAQKFHEWHSSLDVVPAIASLR